MNSFRYTARLTSSMDMRKEIHGSDTTDTQRANVFPARPEQHCPAGAIDACLPDSGMGKLRFGMTATMQHARDGCPRGTMVHTLNAQTGRYAGLFYIIDKHR